ncbi:MAG: hypothetical protein EZS28_018875, partial [Streblomastix strix]
MAKSKAYVMDVIQIHDETLFGNSRYNKVGLVEQVQNTNLQVIILQNAPESYSQQQLDALLLLKADKSELIDSYSKTEDDALLLLKTNVANIVDSYSKSEDDALLLLNADKSELIDSYSKTEDDTLFLLKADKSELIDSYSKTQDDALLLLKANIVDIVDSYSKSEDDALILLKADKSNTYSKTQNDTLLLLKADKSDTYSKTEDDALLQLKANIVDIVDSYSKSEYDALLLLKADTAELIDSYSKTDDDALLLLKANVVDLTNYVELTSAQTIKGQKQFGVIRVSSISKQSKNDASILLAGSGDMLVSSLETQPQLQEVRDIATGKSKAYVLLTQGELNDWMAIQDKVAKLVIGDNLYIVDKEVTDYWWDGTDLKVLETELPDMSNVKATFGAATGGENAITDISIDGNILTPAKNKNFIDKDYDQSISGQKIFNTTIHSVGIMVQTYGNSSVVCARGGVRSIADIQNASYSKSGDNALLLLKADKSTTYSKSETYARDEVYTKGEHDALSLLKADKTQMIDSFTKGETDNLLISKVNTGVSYTKGEDDTLLFAKANKTQLIDSCTKGEADNLLNNKANQTTTYTKIETDQMISQIETGEVDLS